MTAASPLPEPSRCWSLSGTDDADAANDAPHALLHEHAPWHGAGAFADVPTGDDRPSSDTETTLAPALLGVVGDCERGAQTFARLVARWGDGSSYDGDLWLDILEYRDLRMRSLGVTPIGADGRTRLAALEQRLRAKDGSGARQFTRFSCRRTTAIAVRAQGAHSATPTDVVIVDISAGGAKLEPLHTFAIHEGAELDLLVEGAGGPLDMVLPSRVVWLRSGAVGIMFAGAPRRSR